MVNQGLVFKNWLVFLFIGLCLFPLTLRASFIEATIGTAVVNDATATYYNPAALTLLKNSQIVTLGSVAYYRSHFTGQLLRPGRGVIESATSDTNTHYFLPSIYLGIPFKNKVTFGFAVLSNFFDNDLETNSILRYVQSSNRVYSTDFVPGVGIKINDCVSIGAGINISSADFLLKPTTGIPSLNIPDSQSRNNSSGASWGGNAGFLLKLDKKTLLGFNYRSPIIYHLSGTSIFEGNPPLISNNYRYKFWTPARSVLTISRFVTSNLGAIGTVQFIQWSLMKDIHIHGIATQIAPQPTILPNGVIHLHLHNSWVFTLGGQYRMTPKWVVRAAGSYFQSPARGNYQIANGDSIILGVSTGYNLTKNIAIDGSYAHAFIKNENINFLSRRGIVNGVNTGARDGVSLKLTFGA